MKRTIALAAILGVAWLVQPSDASVVLVGTAPTNATDIYGSYATPYVDSNNPGTALNLTKFSDYFSFGPIGSGSGQWKNGSATALGQGPSGTAFGSALVPVGSGTVRLAASGQGPNVWPSGIQTGWVFNQGETTAGADGISLTYNLAKGATATLNYYVGTLNAKFEYSLTAANQTAPLAALTTPTQMPIGKTTTAGGNTFNYSNGVLSFTVQNQDPNAAALVTFKLIYGGSTLTNNPGVGIQAATATVPEPATLGAEGLGALALLRRSRRASEK